MGLLINASRFVLFGLNNTSQAVTLAAIAKRKAINIGRRIIGLPPNPGPGWWDWLKAQWQKFLQYTFGHAEKSLPIPADMPVALFVAIDSTLRDRGGADRNTGAPNYWANARQTVSSPFFWSVQVDFVPNADPKKISEFEEAIEERISRAGYDYNIRPKLKPTRIEIDKPKPPPFTLAEAWPAVAKLPTDRLTALVGLTWKNQQSALLTIDMTGEDFSAFIVGKSGSGKTQESSAWLLSMAYTNSPDKLSMIIIDPKAVDFRPFALLPHLAMPVITDSQQALSVLVSLVAEMDNRTQRAARGDMEFLAHSILVYVDEMADFLASLDSDDKEKVVWCVQRLSQKGRGVGFVIIEATQRVYAIPANAHSLLNVRCVGPTQNASDSVAATGRPGTTTNKLPGRGSFEIYSSDLNGQRVQGAFVADAQMPDYAAKINRFIADINTRWAGQRPYWQPGGQVASEPSAEASQLAAEVEAVEADPKKQELLDRLVDVYTANPASFSVRTVRRVGFEVYGKHPRHDRAKGVYEEFIAAYA